LSFDPDTLWFQSCASTSAPPTPRRKAESSGVARALAAAGSKAGFNQLRQQVMNLPECSRRTAQLAIRRACQQGSIVQDNGQYHLPF
jgi:hypothetical protein